ncbi:hypothetical protein OYT1_ch1693 [Ferriphaselus amnicola]|uniref:Uncharacterized protein n=1 Tax=Ferriphaselus amnicola TaxID=1188319 RepID=A0A2Z6GD32_9PROT|nr:hypothetical protein OYT1_ch1693 [Ferriphaselus amnicola]
MKGRAASPTSCIGEGACPNRVLQGVVVTVKQARTPHSKVGMQRAVEGREVEEGEHHPHLAVR